MASGREDCARPRIHHFYHVFADGRWQEAVAEHLHALKTFGLAEEEGFSFNVGFVGGEQNIAAVRACFDRHSVKWREVASSPGGWEQVTLKALARESHMLEGFAFYAHTKGAAFPGRFNTAWRQRMTYYTVERWREALQSLKAYHAYGCHWMQLQGSWLFGGNFWWTRMSHLRLLPPPAQHSRWAAEGWIGLLPKYIPNFAARDPAPAFPGKIGS